MAPTLRSRKVPSPQRLVGKDSSVDAGVSKAQTPTKPKIEAALLEKNKLPVRAKEAKSGDPLKATSSGVSIPSSASKRPREAEIQDSNGEESDDAAQFRTPVGGKRLVFDDDEQEQFVTPSEGLVKTSLQTSEDPAAEGQDEDENEDEDSDDDAPPEVISSHTAKVQTDKSTNAVAQAAKKQAATQKQKRQERNTLLKQQAKGRKSETKLEPAADTKEIPGSEAEEETVEAPKAAATSKSSLKRKLETPNLLPEELLESDDEEDQEAAQLERESAMKNPKKIKLDVEERLSQHTTPLPQDERIGSTVYRVTAEKGNGKLAPKLSKESKQLKQKLLARHRLPEKKGGFLVKKR